MSRLLPHGSLVWVLGGLLLPASSSWAQAPPVRSVRVRLLLKNNSLEEAFKKIEAETPFHFTYCRADINPRIRVSLRYRNAPVEQVLLDLAKISGLSFRQLNFSVNAARGKHLGAADIVVVITP